MLVDPRCRCLASGRYYELVAGDNCQSYITYTATSSPTSFSCGAGTILDVSACICNHQSLVTCPQQCVTQGNNCQLKTINYTSSSTKTTSLMTSLHSYNTSYILSEPP